MPQRLIPWALAGRYGAAMVAGEAHHLKGQDGVRWVKQWLDYSTRVRTIYENTEKLFGGLLSFTWPYGDQSFSFDLGGIFRGGRLDKQTFMMEVKTYDYESGSLAEEYRKFIAECYVAYERESERCDHLIWASFSPFQAKQWNTHRSVDTIRNHILHRDNRFRVLGTDNEADARLKVSEQTILHISQRIWLLTLCVEQQDLRVLDDHYDHLLKFMRVKEGGDE